MYKHNHAAVFGFTAAILGPTSCVDQLTTI